MFESARASLFGLEQIGIKLGLEQIRALLDALGRPEHAYPSLVIAGTNGKGSVTAMVERGLREAGYRTGRYTSPHLVDLEERFAINGQAIAPTLLDVLAARTMRASSALATPPSFFEATTALALEAFRSAAVEVAVLEVGLGGRLDATNAVHAKAVAITAVDFDHQAYLGYTLEEIAREKAGVIKPGALVVLGENPAAVCREVIDIAAAAGVRLVYAPEGTGAETRMIDGRMLVTVRTPRAAYERLTLALRGRHQVANAITAIRLLEELHASGVFKVPPQAIRVAVEDVTWPGRLELLPWRGGQVLVDGAHNPAGARALASYVLEAFGQPRPFIVGAMRDKDISTLIAALAPAASRFVCTAARSPRAAAPQQLAATIATILPHMNVATAPDAAKALGELDGSESPIVVAGSLYLAGEIRAELL